MRQFLCWLLVGHEPARFCASHGEDRAACERATPDCIDWFAPCKRCEKESAT